MMKVKRNGSVMCVAYHFTREDCRPDKVNICKLFWRFIGFLLLIPLVHALFAVIIGAAYGWGSLSARKLDKYFELVPYEKWPTVAGHRIWPISVITIIGISSCTVYWWAAVIDFLIVVDNFFSRYLGRTCYLYLPLIGALAIWLIYRAFRKTEFWKIFMGYVRAKKKKVCFEVDVI